METKILRPNSKKEIVLSTYQVHEFCQEECQKITQNNSEAKKQLKLYKKHFNALGDYYYYSFLMFKKNYIFYNNIYNEENKFYQEYVDNIYSYLKIGPNKDKEELYLNGTDKIFHFLKYSDILKDYKLKLDSGIIDLDGNVFQCNYNIPIVTHNLIALTILQNILIRSKDANLLLESENKFSNRSALEYLIKYYGYIAYTDFCVTDEIDKRFTPNQQNVTKKLDIEEFYDEFYPIDFRPYQKHLPRSHC